MIRHHRSLGVNNFGLWFGKSNADDTGYDGGIDDSADDFGGGDHVTVAGCRDHGPVADGCQRLDTKEKGVDETHRW